MTHYLLILYIMQYGWATSVTMQEFASKAQCEVVLQHVTAAHGQYRDSECFPLMPGDSQ